MTLRISRTVTAAAVLGLAGLAGCGDGAEGGPGFWQRLAAAPRGEAPEVTRGRAAYRRHCTACHGPGGHGDGPLAADLPVAPADLTMLSAANGGTFPRDRVFEQVHGYPGRFNTSVMPEFGPLLEGPQVPVVAEDGAVVPTPRALVDLVAWLDHVQQT